jgi:hypothetical protein
MVLNSMGNVKKRQGILHQEKWLRTCSDLSPSDRSSQTQTLRTRLKQDPHPGGFGRDTPYPCVQWIFRFFFSFLSETIFGIRINSSPNISPVSSVHVTLTVIDQFPAGAWTPPDQITRQMRMARARWLPAEAPPSGARPGTGERPAPAPRRLRPCRLVAHRTGTRPTRATPLDSDPAEALDWSALGCSPFAPGVAVRGHGRVLGGGMAWHQAPSPCSSCRGTVSGGSVARPHRLARCTCRPLVLLSARAGRGELSAGASCVAMAHSLQQFQMDKQWHGELDSV